MATYGPLPFLPPDAQGAVVLQATLGHAGGIAFGRCAGGRARGPYARTSSTTTPRPSAACSAAGSSQCRSLFLAGSDVLRQPPETVAAYLETIAATFPIDPASATICGSATSPSTTPASRGSTPSSTTSPHPGPTATPGGGSASLHLRRVSLGVESGDPGVRSLYRKSWDE